MGMKTVTPDTDSCLTDFQTCSYDSYFDIQLSRTLQCHASIQVFVTVIDLHIENGLISISKFQLYANYRQLSDILNQRGPL